MLCVGVRVWIGGGASAWERIVEFRQEMGVNIKEWEISPPPELGLAVPGVLKVERGHMERSSLT